MKRIAAVVVLVFVSVPLFAMKGAVYSAAGKVANAKIEVYAVEDRNVTIDRLLDGQRTVPLATATTDASGLFSAEVRTDAAVWVKVTATGFAPDVSLVSAKADDLVFDLTAAPEKNGVVRSSSGPVAGAKVFVFGGGYDVAAVYETDDHGRFSMPDPQRWAAGICVQHASYAVECRNRNQEQLTPVSLDFTLAPGTVVTGRVVTSDGKPVAKARVVADSITRTTTAEDGTFKIRVSSTIRHLRATANGMTGSAAVATAPATITLEQGRTVSGNARDDKGHATPGVRVVLYSEEDSMFDAVVNAKGEYVANALAPARYRVYVEAPDALDFEMKEIDLRKKSSARVDLTATTAELVQGIVRDENHHPVAGATVIQLEDQTPVVYGTTVGYTTTVSGPDGRFRMHVPHAGRFAAIKPGYAAGMSGKLDEGTSGKDVVITLPAGIEVRGIVAGSDDKPVADAGIVIMVGSSTLGQVPIASSLASGVVDSWVRTDEHGAFSVRLNPGVHDLGVWKKGYSGRDVGNVNVTESIEPIRIVLAPSVQIRGSVALKGKKQTEGLAVYAMQESQRSFAMAAVAADGTFVLDSLEPGVYMLRLSNSHSTVKTVTAPAKDVVIEAAETVDIHGHVTDKATGAPVTHFEVGVDSGNEYADSSEVDDPNGEFVQAVPAGGPVQLSVSASGYVAGRLNIAAPDKSEPVSVALTKGRKITGRITSSDGHPVGDASALVAEASRSGAMSDDEGEFTIDGAPTEEITLDVSKEGFVSARKVVAAGTGDQRVDITLGSGLKMTGRVVDKSGAPVEGAQISASSNAENAEFASATSDKSGAFTIQGLAPARYSFVVNKPQAGQAKQDDVDVTKPQTLVFTLGSDPTGTIHGTLAGASGGGWMMAMVMVTSDRGSASGQVGRDGKFVVENAPAGDVTVRAMLMSAERQSSTRAVHAVVPEGGDVQVDLTTAGDVSVRGVVRSGGQPVAGATVSFWSGDDGANWQSPTNSDGAYELTGMEAGHYRASVTRPAGGQYSTEFDVTASATLDINIEFAQIAGHVIDDRGAAVEGAKVKTSSGAGHSGDAEATSDASGAFAFTVQGGSDHRVSAVKSGYVVSYVDVPDGSTSPVTLQLHRGNGARVRLVDVRDGSTLNGFVVVRDETGAVQIPINGDRQSDGSLLLALPEGTYRVSASAGDYASNTITMTVPAPDATIPLSRGGTLVVQSDERATELIRLVMPNGDEYVRCYCNGIAEIRLTGALTKVDHVAPGPYRMDVVDAHGATRHSYPIAINEGQTTTVDATK